MLTEFGEIGYKVDGDGGWGYTSVKSAEAFLSDYQRVLDSCLSVKHTSWLLLHTTNGCGTGSKWVTNLYREPKGDLKKKKQMTGGIGIQWFRMKEARTKISVLALTFFMIFVIDSFSICSSGK